MSPWPMQAIRHLGQVTLGKMLQTEPRNATDVELPYLRAAHIQPDGTIIDASSKKMWFSAKDRIALDLRAGDVVVVEGGAGYGRSAYIHESMPGWGFQNSIVRIRPHSHASNGRFLDYALQSALSEGRIQLECNTATFSHFTAEKVSAFRLPTPSFCMQRSIADYLDDETSKIDELIEKQRQLIDVLRYRREALRDHLVLRARSSVGMRPLKYSARLTVGIVVTPAAWYADTGHIALRGTNIRDEGIDITDVVHLTDEGHYGHAKSTLTVGDVVVVRTGQAGTAACVPPNLDGVNAIDVLIVKPDQELDGDYLAMTLNASSTRTLMAVSSVGAIQGHFNTSSLANLDVPVPPLEEQLRLVQMWHEKRDRIDTLIARTERMIEVSKEHRAALITMAVTGQIDVRDLEPREEAA